MTDGPSVLLLRAADLVQRWGGEHVAGQGALRDVLSVDGLPLWDAMAAELAVYVVPTALAEPCPPSRVRSALSPYAAFVRRLLARRTASACAAWPSRDTALLLGFSGYMARDILLPIGERLARSGRLEPVGLSAAPVLTAAPSFPWHLTSTHWDGDMSRHASRARALLRRALDTLVAHSAWIEQLVPEDRSLSRTLAHALVRTFRNSVQHSLVAEAVTARRVLDCRPPVVVVSPDVADPRTRIFTLLASGAGIPTLEVQFGAYGAEATEWRFFAADAVAVWGQQSKEVLMSHGVPGGAIRITGSPRYDALVGANEDEVRHFRRRFAVPKGARTVVFASASVPDAYKHLADIGLLNEMKSALFRAADRTDGICLIVKPHPLEDIPGTQALAAGCNRVVFAERHDDIRLLIRACDAFVSLGSTTMLDALILGKPTICPSFPGWAWSEFLTAGGAQVVPRSAAEVLEVMSAIAADGGAGLARERARSRTEFLEYWLRDGGKGGTDRVAALAEDLASGAWRTRPS